MSDFQADVIYDAGKTYTIRFGGKKYNFKQNKPTSVTDRACAQKFDKMPGFSVQVTAGELYDETPAKAVPAKKKLVPKKKKKRGK